MNKKEFVEKVADTLSMKKTEAEGVIEGVFDVIKDALNNGDDVSITGFGKFKMVNVAQRNGRNPATGESLVIPATTRVKFKASSKM